VNIEPIEFEHVSETTYVYSSEFLKNAANLLREVFSDFEGVMISKSSQSNFPMVDILFNHLNTEDDERAKACKLGSAKTTGNTTLDSIRRRDYLVAEGDRYYLSDDGMDFFERLLVPAQISNNGKPNWKKVVSEYVDKNPGNMYNFGKPTQYTKVMISMSKLAELIYGEKINDVRFSYDVKIKAPVGYAGMASDYIITIDRINSDAIRDIYQKLGFTTSNSGIVR
jgi:hypothetical protein